MGKEVDHFKLWLIVAFIVMMYASFSIASEADEKVNKLKAELHNATEHYKSENQRAEMFVDYYRIAYGLLSPEKKERFHEKKKAWGY